MSYEMKKYAVLTFAVLIILGAILRTFFENSDPDQKEIDELSSRALIAAGGGDLTGVKIVIAPAWELECGGSCIHYSKKLIEVATGDRWRQDLMHEVTHWALFQSGSKPGYHHALMYSRGLCYGGCDDVPTANPHQGE